MAFLACRHFICTFFFPLSLLILSLSIHYIVIQYQDFFINFLFCCGVSPLSVRESYIVDTHIHTFVSSGHSLSLWGAKPILWEEWNNANGIWCRSEMKIRITIRTDLSESDTHACWTCLSFCYRNDIVAFRIWFTPQSHICFHKQGAYMGAPVSKRGVDEQEE